MSCGLVQILFFSEHFRRCMWDLLNTTQASGNIGRVFSSSFFSNCFWTPTEAFGKEAEHMSGFGYTGNTCLKSQFIADFRLSWDFLTIKNKYIKYHQLDPLTTSICLSLSFSWICVPFPRGSAFFLLLQYKRTAINNTVGLFITLFSARFIATLDLVLHMYEIFSGST